MTIQTKNMDLLFLKHGIKIYEFQRALVDFDLENDPEVIKQKKANEEIRKNAAENAHKAASEMKNAVDSIFDEEFRIRFETAAKMFGKPEVTPNDLIGFDSFMSI